MDGVTSIGDRTVHSTMCVVRQLTSRALFLACRRFSVAAVIDLFPRRVAGWYMSDQMVTEALLMAILRRGRLQELLRQSDQGGQYTGEPFQRLMADQGVTCSLSRSGNVWENAAMESLFSSPKTERVRRKPAGPENSRAPLCSITSSGSTTHRAATRPLAIQVPWPARNGL